MLKKLLKKTPKKEREALLEEMWSVTPRDDDHLHDWVHLYLGVYIPRRVHPSCRAKGHVAPFTAFADAYFARSEVSVWQASRGLGRKSSLLALLTLTEMITLGASTRVLGGSGKQSENVHQYLTGIHPDMRGMFLNAPNAPQGVVSQQTATVLRSKNGGYAEALKASQTSVRGPHPQRLRLDECVSGDTLVSTPHGPKRIGSLARGDAVYGWNGREIASGVVSLVVDKGVRETLRLTFANGASLICTPDHKILTREGWREAHELREGDTVVAEHKTMHCVRWESQWQAKDNNGIVPDLLSRQEVQPAELLRRLPLQDQLALNDMPLVLCGSQIREQTSLHRLRDRTSAKRNQAMPTLLALRTIKDRGPAAHDGSARNGFEVERSNVKSGTSGYGVVGDSDGSISTSGGSRQVDRRLHIAGSQRSGGDSRSVLARPPDGERARCQKASDPGETGISRGVFENGSHASVGIPASRSLRLESIEPGPRTDVWDISVPRLHSFVANTIIVHNCDEMELDIFEAAMGQTLDSPTVESQTVCSSTHQHPDGTFSEIKRRAKSKGWNLLEWCYRENLLENGGTLTWEQVHKKKKHVTDQMWEAEFEGQEPNPGNRMFTPEQMLEIFPGDPDEQDLILAEAPFHLELIAPGEGVYYHGTDWGKSHYTVILTIIERSGGPNELAAYGMFNKMAWPEMVGLHNERVALYGGVSAHDATGVGGVVDDYLTVDSEGFDFSSGRMELLNKYIGAGQHGEYVYPRIAPLYYAHKFLTYDHLLNRKHLPDEIAAAALAHYAKENQTSAIYIGRAV